MHSSRLATVLLALPILYTAGMAQARATTDDGPRRRVFLTLEDRQWVRVAGPEFGRQEGRILERSDTGFVLSRDREPLHVPATSIDTLWTRGSSMGTGALVGFVLGGTLGTLAGLSCKEGDDCSRS
jgi:hypothetical protein